MFDWTPSRQGTAAKIGKGVAAGGVLHEVSFLVASSVFGGGLRATPPAMRGRGLWVARVAADWFGVAVAPDMAP
jgi:hypothetical protein